MHSAYFVIFSDSDVDLYLRVIVYPFVVSKVNFAGEYDMYPKTFFASGDTKQRSGKCSL